ncbi:MAG: transaldolase [Cellulomonadaceae bacterium]
MTEVPSAIACLSASGVAVWLDDLSRELIQTGELARLTAERGVVGVTTNPTIFAKALSEDVRYAEQLGVLAAVGTSVDDAVVEITTDDVRDAVDILAPVHERTAGRDGRVSIEVDPRLAHDTEATVAAARALWQRVDRPALFIKIPATREGLTAIADAVADGISVNVTLIFSLKRYREVVDAYLTGLEIARERGLDLSTIHSVASFFLSRVDVAVDPLLTAIGTDTARGLRGGTAVANARLAYGIHLETLESDRWRALAAVGATPQRPLWASTGTKDPSLPDTLYVDSLVAPGTVNTMPRTTLEDVADHGATTSDDTDTITSELGAARRHLDALAQVGVDLAAVTQRLEDEGVEKFVTSWSELLDSVSAGLASATDPSAVDR